MSIALTYEFNSSIFDTSRNLVAALQPKTNCARTALTLIVQDCSELSSSNEDTTLRVSLAIGLAVCEFKASHVVYPSVCDDVEDTKAASTCTSQLISSPQWWTTYHGCYNSVKQICHMEEASRECERALRTHSQIIDMQEKLHDKMGEYYDFVGVVSGKKDQVLEFWNDTFVFMSETLGAMRSASVSLNREYKENFAQAEEQFLVLSKNLEEARNKVEELGWVAQGAIQALSKSTLDEQAVVAKKLRYDADDFHNHMVTVQEDTAERLEVQMAQSLAKMVVSSDQLLFEHVSEVSSKLTLLMTSLETAQKRNMDMQEELEGKVRGISDDITGFTETVKEGLEASETLLKVVKSKVQLVNGIMQIFSQPVKSAFQLASLIVMVRVGLFGGVYVSLGVVVGSVLGVWLMQ